jgi:hypothetical protein
MASFGLSTRTAIYYTAGSLFRLEVEMATEKKNKYTRSLRSNGQDSIGQFEQPSGALS